MAVNRTYWKAPFETFPSWLCPKCQSGTLALDSSTFKVVEPSWSQEGHSCEAWEPDWMEKRFSGLLVCQNAACGEVVSMGGQTQHIEDHDWAKQEQHWLEVYKPTFLSPSPPIFPISEKCPKIVKYELEKAFSLFWFTATFWNKGCANSRH